MSEQRKPCKRGGVHTDIMVSNRKMKQRLGIKGKISNTRRSTAFSQDTPGVFRVVSTECVKQKITTE
ncbi:hypothetical protein FN906_25145 [Salmonella enterica subsp. enterica]|nr:hypothetical protein [Salmonella enterica subsp. enterica serovar Brazzaville]